MKHLIAFFLAVAACISTHAQTAAALAKSRLRRGHAASHLHAIAHGTVRVAQSIDPSAIQPGNTIDIAIACVGTYWPLRSTPAHMAQTSSDSQKKQPEAGR